MAVLFNIASDLFGANHTDRPIDAVIHELYGFSDRKIALVDEATP